MENKKDSDLEVIKNLSFAVDELKQLKNILKDISPQLFQTEISHVDKSLSYIEEAFLNLKPRGEEEQI